MELDKLNEKLSENRTKEIFKVSSKVSFEAEDEGITLNEGYEYSVNGALPEIADGIAKFAIELEKEFGNGSDKLFISLINDFYNKTKGE